MSYASKLAALRIARRTAARSKGRSALILAMVGLPVFGMVTASVLVRTADPSNAEKTSRAIGTADARVMRVMAGPLEQVSTGDGAYTGLSPTEEPAAPVKPAALLRLLPPGATLTPHGQGGEVRARTRVATTAVEWTEVDLAHQLNEGLVRNLTGRLPKTASEVVVTPALLARTGAVVGGPVRLVEPDRTLTVVGTAVLPNSTRARALLALPGAISGQRTFDSFLLGLPHGTQVADVQAALNRRGWLVTPRSTFLDPPDFGSGIRAEEVGVALVVGGLAALEVILLAGAAFAVGARRQRRELGLIAATGGDRSHVRDVVLGGGVVIGVAAALVGVAAGVLTAAVLAPWLERRFSTQLFGAFDVQLTEVGGAAALGLVTAVLAAVLPARTAARQPVVDALTGRRGVVRSPARLTLAGIVAIAVGAFIAAKGAVPPAHFNQILTGAVIAELGFVACSPIVVGLAGRLAGMLPLPLRLAVRDSARNRTRSGPAVAAVMAALAGAVAVSVYQASDTERQRKAYQPRAQRGQGIVYNGAEQPVSRAVTDELARELPVQSVIPLEFVQPRCGDEGCRGDRASVRVERQLDEPAECLEPTASPCFRVESVESNVTVADEATLRAIAGRVPPNAVQAFARGAAAVLEPRLVQDGHVTVEVETLDEPVTGGAPAKPSSIRRVRLPAVLVGSGPLGADGRNVIVSTATARKHSWRASGNVVLLDMSRPPTAAETERADAVLLRHGMPGNLYVERGFQSDRGVALLALLAAATVVALGASTVATGLAAADGRPDLATLAAVGASPRVRRVLAMSQAATIAFLGSALGVLAGLVPATAVIKARTDFPLVIPWPVLALTVAAVPTVIALLAGVFTRSRLPLERRIA